MVVALVHGNPETTVVWHRLIPELEERGVEHVETLAPPGFGAPLPVGWEPTMANYGQWLIESLAQYDEPVDLVGHDWGVGHCVWAFAHAPELVRSLVTDSGLAVLDPERVVWHDMAQRWRTPEYGEKVIAGMLGARLTDRAEAMVDVGVPESDALLMASLLDEEMGRCILGLYRSADDEPRRELRTNVFRNERPPWLSIHNPNDSFGVGVELPIAEELGLDIVNMDDTGHWWMLEAPSVAADILTRFWT